MFKKKYQAPALRILGTVEKLTGYTSTHDVFGGGFLSSRSKAVANKQAPSDFSS